MAIKASDYMPASQRQRYAAAKNRRRLNLETETQVVLPHADGKGRTIVIGEAVVERDEEQEGKTE